MWEVLQLSHNVARSFRLCLSRSGRPVSPRLRPIIVVLGRGRAKGVVSGMSESLTLSSDERLCKAQNDSKGE